MADEENKPESVVGAALREKLDAWEQLCVEIASLAERSDSAAEGEFGALKERVPALPELPPEYAEILDRKLAETMKACEHAQAKAGAERAQRDAAQGEIGNLLGELERMGAAESILPLKRQLERVEREWAQLLRFVVSGDERVTAYAEKNAALHERLNAEETVARNAFDALLALTEELAALVAAADCSLIKERKPGIDSAFSLLHGTLNMEEKRTRETEARFREQARKASSMLSQHFQALDLARWESYTLKLDILKELEALAVAEEKELPAAARKLRQIRERWRSLGAVPREKQQETGPRFHTLTDTLQKRIDEHYRVLHAEQREAAAAKTALCEKAESLMAQTEWNVTADALKLLQQEWKLLRHAGREQDDALYSRFRAACNHFFDARSQYFEQRNQSFAAVIDAKIALCEEAEALTEGADAGRKARDLRARYQAAGAAGRREPELAKRFNAALDAFFNARRAEFSAHADAFKGLIVELEGLDFSNPEAAETRARQIQNELSKIGPLPKESAPELGDREHRAWTRCEKELARARMGSRKDKLVRMKPLALELGGIWELLRDGAQEDASARLALLDDGDYAPFPALARFLLLLRGSETNRLERQLQAARAEHERILGALERGSRQNAGNDLASELAAAIAGNFGAGVRAAPPVDRAKMLEAYLAAGPMEVAALEDSFRRFDAAWKE